MGKIKILISNILLQVKSYAHFSNFTTKGFIAVATTGIGYVLGGFDNPIKYLVMVTILDYITGILRAGYHKKLDSRVGLKGIIKKLFYFFMVALANILDDITNANGLIRNTLTYFFIANEGLSMLENYTACDLPMIPFLKEKLEQLKGYEEKRE